METVCIVSLFFFCACIGLVYSESRLSEICSVDVDLEQRLLFSFVFLLYAALCPLPILSLTIFHRPESKECA